MTTAKLNELRDDKERFVAFSFAAADLLIELDASANICFISGAAKGITGRDADDLMGSPFVDVLDPLDRRMVSYLLKNMKEGERISLLVPGWKIPMCLQYSVPVLYLAHMDIFI
ncbi:PAS domain-containing protein [Sneathiella glossodoripedis]|uniref:PAS domain-containing protein n=1 Tax=Sneathiella glossodoripedis TaxID=418853 RepID=UPI0004710E61|nr:PAS domain-containing protein [Sneathiella glossodoripedis]